ncbi:MAG: DUF3150 domain-containing protein [Spartobacteria bacterium]|nr:DUF3150 domain-containing protein [Spartobacteria bacterium]
MNTHTDIKVLDSLLALHLEVNIWTARKKLSPEDFAGATLPPEDLASLGSKRVCDPEALRVFGTLKARAVSLLDRHGVRFLGGWAIPESQADAIVTELGQILQDFNAAKEDFLSRYDESVRDWIAKHSGWEQIIADSTVSADYVRSRMGFLWRLYRIVPPNPADPVMEGLKDEVASLGQTLFGEVSKAATEAWHKCFAGKTEITRKALSPLRTIHQKLSGLSFVEPRVSPVADLIHTAFEHLPKRGRIEGANLLMLQGLVSLLRDTDALIEHGQKIMDGTTSKDLLSLLVEGQGEMPELEVQEEADIVAAVDDLPPIFPDIPMQPVLPNCGLW